MRRNIAFLTALICVTVLLGCGRTAEEWYAEGKKYSDLVQYEKALPCYDNVFAELDRLDIR